VLKVGLIGCGGRGTGAALQALSAEKGTVVLTALADPFQERIDACLKGLREALGEAGKDRLRVTPEGCFTGFDGYRKLIASGVDVVLLASPPHFRPQHLSAVAEAGLHSFCEKPVAVDAPGYRSVMESVKVLQAKKKSLVGGFCWRYNVRNRALYERVLSGAIGEVQAVYSTYLTGPLAPKARRGGESDLEYQVRNWFPFLWMSGDHLVEQAVHSIDKQQWAFRDVPPVSAVAIGGRVARGSGPEEGNIWDHFSVHLRVRRRPARLPHLPPDPGLLERQHRPHLRHGRHRQGRGLDAQLRDLGQAALGLRGRGQRHVPAGARRAVRLDPLRQADQRRRVAGAQQHGGDHGPHGRVHGPDDHLGDGDAEPAAPGARELRAAGAAGRPAAVPGKTQFL